jgi:hypothetical protein
MNGALIHVALNHLPVVGILFGTVLLLGGLLLKKDSLIKGALALLVLAGLSAVPSFLTGEAAEEVVGRWPGVSDMAIDQHEKAADFALAASLIVGAVAGVGIFLLKKRGGLSNAFLWTLFVVSLWACTVLARTAHLGGLIRHPEISTATPPAPNS